MKHKFLRLHALIFTWRAILSEELLAFALAMLVIVAPASAVTRLLNRSLFMQSTVPGATTSYRVSFQYQSPPAVGSVDMLFCEDPIPYLPCVPPPGLDVSQATLSAQTGETGFTIDSSTHTSNHILLTRTPTAPTATGLSSYTLSGVVNPTGITHAFSIRLKSLGSTDGTGPQIDVGSVRGQSTNSIVIETQVPPMLIFCLAQQVALGCTSTNDTYYSDMGELSPDSTLTAQSQMAVGTNASSGFVITANGSPLASGTNVIDGLPAPTQSERGTNQFGINLVANDEPTVGGDPEGPFTNAEPAVDYSNPNHYKFVSGDLIASSPNVSLMRKFTVSYIVNSDKDLHPGVYTTTITFIASGRF